MVTRTHWLLSGTLAALLAATAPGAEPENEAATAAFAAAGKLQNLESYELASAAWTRFLQQFPNDPRADRATHYLGVCQLKQKRFAEAAATLQSALAKYPQSELSEGSLLYLGISQFNLGQAGKPDLLDAAKATFDTLVARFPKGKHLGDALFYRAEYLYARGKKAEAAAEYRQFLAGFATHKFASDALYALGVCQEELGDAAAAQKTYDDFLARFPENRLAPEVGMRRGLTLAATGNFAEAIPWLERAAARPGFPSADYALLRQGDALMQLKRYPEAATLLASLGTRFPQSRYAARAQILAGKALYLAGQFAQAQKLLEALTGAPGPLAAEAAHWAVLALVKQGKAEAAIALADRILAQPGEMAGAAQLSLDAADALYEIPNRRNDAIARYAATAGRFPRDPVAPQALYMAAFVALEQADYQQASKYAKAFASAYGNHELVVDALRVEAESSLHLGRYPEAAQLFAQLVARSPKHGDVEQWQVRRLLALQLEKKHAEVAAAAEPLLGQLRTPDARAEAAHLLGASRLALGQAPAAVQALQAALAAQPKWRQADETMLALAEAHRRAGDLAQAQAAVRRLIAEVPGSRSMDRAYFRLGEYSYAGGDYQTAATAYRRVVDLWPQGPWAGQAMYELGCTQLNLQDAAGAEKTLSAFLEKQPEHALAARARYARGMARQQQQKFPAAIEDLEAAMASPSLGEERPNARYLLGLCQMGLKQHSSAVKTFQTLLDESPQYAGADNALYQLGWAWKLGAQEAKAATVFARLASTYPKSPLAAEAHHHVGEAAYQAQDYQKASEAYFQASQKAAGSELGEKATHKLAWAFFHLGQFDRALQTFRYQQGAYPKGPLEQDAAFMAAECLFKQGKFAEALDAYKEVRGPSSKEFHAQSLLHAGQAAAQLKQWPKSLELLAGAAAQFPDSASIPEILYEKGWAQQNLNQTDQALESYRAVIEKSGREAAARAQFMIGEIQFERKQHEKAVESFLKVTYGYSYPRWQADAAFEAGRCFEALGMKSQAIKVYNELLEKFAGSDKASLAKQRLEELK